jgi:hypothetical protein
MAKFFWGLLKDIAFWVFTPILLIAIGAGFGWLGTTFAYPVLTFASLIFIAVGVIWLALLWLGATE